MSANSLREKRSHDRDQTLREDLSKGEKAKPSEVSKGNKDQLCGNDLDDTAIYSAALYFGDVVNL